MDFNFLWIIGFALLCAWLFANVLTPEEKKSRSWYSIPLIGATLCIMWVLIQLAQTVS